MSRPPYPPSPAPSRHPLSPQRFPDAPPAPAVRAALWLRQALLRLARRIGPPELSVFEDVTSSALVHGLVGLIRAGVPQALERGPGSAEELAAELGLDADALYRALRAARVKGYFRLRRDGRFEHNARSRDLCSSPSRARELLLYFGSGSNQAAWAAFEHVLRTGESAFEHVHGMSVWEWFEQNPDELEVFAEAMLGLCRADAPVIARLYPFEELGVVCDVGGGRGTLLSELLVRHGHLSGMLHDSARMIDLARPLLAARGVLERVTLVPGSFFEAVPSGADAYVLKNVLHDWDDARALSILRNVRAAAAGSTRLLLAEALVDRASRHPIAVPSDLQMMVACSRGRERSEQELARLLDAGGFRLRRVFAYPTIAVLEALPL